MRTPISRVRCATRYASTPWTPTAASASASAANKPSSSIMNRCSPSVFASVSSSGSRPKIGSCGSISRIAARTAGATASGIDGRPDRKRERQHPGLCQRRVGADRGGLRQAMEALVADDANDRPLLPPEPDLLAQRIAGAEEPLGGRPVDEEHALGRRRVGVAEQPSANQRHPERAEILRATRAAPTARASLRPRFRGRRRRTTG